MKQCFYIASQGFARIPKMLPPNASVSFFLHWCFDLNKPLHLYTYDSTICLCVCRHTHTYWVHISVLLHTGLVNELSEAEFPPENGL